MNINVLIVSPYLGMQHLAKQICHGINNPALHFSFVLFDRHEAEAGLKKVLQKGNFDLIISRGGTAALLKKITSTSVVDVGISKYDILNIIHAANRVSSLAFVGFPELTTLVTHVSQEFQLNLRVLTVNNDMELAPTLKELKKEKNLTIICDATVDIYAQKYGLNTIFLLSGVETIRSGIVNSCSTFVSQYKLKGTIQMYKYFLNHSNKKFIILNKIRNAPELISDDLKKHPKLEKLFLEAISKDQDTFIYKNNYFKISKINFSNYTFFTTTQNRIWQNNDSSTSDCQYILNSYKSELFADIFSVAYKDKITEQIDLYSKDNVPVLIIGEPGLGKNYLGLQISNRTFQGKHDTILIDLTNKDSFKRLLNSEDSVLYNSNNTLILSKFNQLSSVAQQEFLNFAQNTKLYSRNKLIYTFEQKIEDGMNPNLRTLVNNAHKIYPCSLRDLDRNKFIMIITKLINNYTKTHEKIITKISDLALDFVLNQKWQFNFAELIDVLSHAMDSTKNNEISAANIQDGLNNFKKTHHLLTHSYIKNHQEAEITNDFSLEDVIYQTIVDTILKNNGNKTAAAKQLKISRATLWRYLKNNT
ncbi:PrpR N-terminal domain-containing protein [Pediococcus acidilactici]|uniref:PrpR N-terminal domain-containing protein n=1 Tax=Pediococcus acidilactici TaxID=1254 RepID=UPI001C700C78|nr:PrpR N-terminal domain-containing protein [Pediococcus acidilactici]